MISPFRRSLILIGIALALPLCVVTALLVSSMLRSQEGEVQREALDRAREIVALSDSRLEADLSALRVLATASTMRTHDWVGALARADRVAHINKHWRMIFVSDLSTGKEILNTMRPDRSPTPGFEDVLQGAHPEREGFGAVTRKVDGCPCIFLHVPIDDGSGTYVLSVGIDPAVYQSILMSHIAHGLVSAIVDRKGLFIARSLDADNRVGTPATSYVREAITHGNEGFYPGITLEGFKNYSAYHISDLSGWSAHVAVASALIDTPKIWSNATLVGGSGLSLLLAAGLITFALNDIAVRRRTAERLAQAQKMEAIGQLAGGIAHDLNNLLTPVIGGLDLIQRGAHDERLKRLAANALEAARRGERLTRQLLTFSRGHKFKIEPIDLGEIVGSMTDLLRRTVGSSVGVTLDIDSDARWVTSDATQIEVALINLALNARDAMPQGGTIVVSTEKAQVEHKNFVALIVKDTGTGMTPEVAARASDPFFTTKSTGKGTGLGLAQAAFIAAQSGGSLQIDSQVGRGTSIRMLFPAATPNMPPALVKPAAAPTNANGSFAEIMIVDDDDYVRTFVADALLDAGYSVIALANGPAALARIADQGPDLLLTDYSMPEMTGTELIERARMEQPDLPIILISGYLDGADLGALDHIPVLSKPVSAPELLTAVERALKPADQLAT